MNKNTKLTSSQLKRIIQQSQDYTSFILKNKPKYPKVFGILETINAKKLELLGFIKSIDFQKLSAKSKKSGKHLRPLPNADIVASEVQKAMSGMSDADMKGNLTIGEWNMEFLDKSKVKYFAKAYAQIVPKLHLLYVEETDSDGLAALAQIHGYSSYCSVANNRGQAVGFLVHPRLKVIGKPKSYDNLANVQGIPDLRPGFAIDLEDSVSGVKFTALVVHLKSMRGGPVATGKVRYRQLELLNQDLGSEFTGIIAGDFNTFLNNTSDTDPLSKNGFKLVNPSDATTTQSMGGRLDGFFTKGQVGCLTKYNVRPFFKNPLITRGLSDHGLLTVELRLKDYNCNQ